METVQFNERDAELLYSCPKPASDLAMIIRCFMSINRVAAPTYEEVTSCLRKAQQAGIIREMAAKFVVESNWYDRIHAADESSANEIESMLSFEETFVGINFVGLRKQVTPVSRVGFLAMVNALR